MAASPPPLQGPKTSLRAIGFQSVLKHVAAGNRGTRGRNHAAVGLDAHGIRRRPRAATDLLGQGPRGIELQRRIPGEIEMTPARLLDPSGGGNQLAGRDGPTRRLVVTAGDGKETDFRTPRSSSSCSVRSIVFHVDGTKTICTANGSLRFAACIDRSALR